MTRVGWVGVEPRGRDAEIVLRILSDTAKLNRVTKLTVRCEADRHTLARLLLVGGEVVFVVEARRDTSTKERDEVSGRRVTVPGTGHWRTIVYIDEVPPGAWSARCPCGSSVIPRSWVVRQYRDGHTRAVFPESEYRAVEDERRMAELQQDLDQYLARHR